MPETNDHHRERFASLPLPLRSIGAECSQRPNALMGEGKVFGAGSCSSEFRSLEPRVDFSLIELGGMTILAGKTTPLACREEGRGISSVIVCYQGSPTYKEGSSSLRLQKGGILMNPRQGAEIRTGFLSSFNFPIEHQRMQRTLRVMQGEDSKIDLDQAILLDPGESEPREKPPSPLSSFFAYLDALLQENRYMSMGLGLDEQIYRLLAFSLLQLNGSFASSQQRWMTATARWSAGLDTLVDYIHTHAHLNLTLTDLEEQSHYSGRRLQQLFRQRFDCTPMQYVRRQRLGNALQKLQSALPGDTVTRIARDCGYRHISNFTTDFRKQYGRHPSSLLRTSRSQQQQKAQAA